MTSTSIVVVHWTRVGPVMDQTKRIAGSVRAIVGMSAPRFGAMQDAVERLVDEGAVRDVMLHYARGVDGRDWEQVRGCFASDAFVAGTGHSGVRDEYLDRLVAGVTQFGVTMHTVGNQLVELQGDTARTETDLVARHFRDAEGRDEALVLGVRYHDHLRRDGAGWVITHREVRRLWSRP